MEGVVPSLESVFDVWDEGLSNDRRRIWGGRIFRDGCWSLGVGPVFPPPMKMGFGVESRENSGETMTLSMLWKPEGSEPGVSRRNGEVTHDEHAQGAGQESNTRHQNAFEVSSEPLRHRSAALGKHEPGRRGKREPARESGEIAKDRRGTNY